MARMTREEIAKAKAEREAANAAADAEQRRQEWRKKMIAVYAGQALGEIVAHDIRNRQPHEMLVDNIAKAAVRIAIRLVDEVEERTK